MIEESERDLIESIIDFGDTVAREIMVPRTDMVTFAEDFHVADVRRDRHRSTGSAAFPCIGESFDDIVGIVYAKDLMRAERDGGDQEPVGQLMRPAHFVPETKRVAELLHRDADPQDPHRRRRRRVRRDRRDWSRSRTCSRSWSGRSATSSTAKRWPSSPCPTATSSWSTPRMNVDELNERTRLSFPKATGTRSVAWCSPSSAGCPSPATSSSSRATASSSRRSTGGESDECASSPWPRPTSRRGRVGRPMSGDEVRAARPRSTSVRDSATRSPRAFDRASSRWSAAPTWASRRCSTASSGRKVSIVSDKPQTTAQPDPRRAQRGPDCPGRLRRHPRDPQAPDADGRAAQRHGASSPCDVDVVCLLLDATAKVGTGDASSPTGSPTIAILVVNKSTRRDAGAWPSWSGGRHRAARPTSRSRRRPARASTAWSSTSWRACRPVPGGTPTTW